MIDENRIVPVTAHLIEINEFAHDGQTPIERKIETYDFYAWLKLSPEVMGIISAIGDDILGDKFDWKGSDSDCNKAKDFAKRNHFRKKLYSVIQDYLLIGDGYLGVKFVNEKSIVEFLDETKKDFGVNITPGRGEYFLSKLRTRLPDVFGPRELFVLKATTIKINYDQHGVIHSYIQKVPGISRTVEFSPREVIHFSLNNLGHDVYGNSPFNSCLNEIAVLWYAKDYAGMFFQNDGTPDYMYIMKNEDPNSPNFKKVVRSIKEMRLSKNKHKSMVLTGEVEVQKINAFNKDLEFQSLIDTFTQRIMMAWNMDPARLSSIKGNKSNVGASEGYYKKINRIQLELEETLNTELFWKFGNVEIQFPKVYKRDESREADIITKLVGKPVLTINEGREYIGKLPKEDPELDELNSTQRYNPNDAPGAMNEAKNPEDTGNQYQDTNDKKGVPKDKEKIEKVKKVKR